MVHSVSFWQSNFKFKDFYHSRNIRTISTQNKLHQTRKMQIWFKLRKVSVTFLKKIEIVWNSSNTNEANRSVWQFGWWKFVVKRWELFLEFVRVFAVFIISPNVHLLRPNFQNAFVWPGTTSWSGSPRWAPGGGYHGGGPGPRPNQK